MVWQVIAAGSLGLYALYKYLTSDSNTPAPHSPSRPRPQSNAQPSARRSDFNTEVTQESSLRYNPTSPQRTSETSLRYNLTSRQRTQRVKTLYHYTDLGGYYGIEMSGVIRASRFDQGRIVRFDEGVYLTSVPPSAGKYAVAKACWGPNAANAKIRNGQVDYAFEVSLPRNRVKKCHPVHDVHLYEDDIDRDTFPWTAHRLTYY